MCEFLISITGLRLRNPQIPVNIVSNQWSDATSLLFSQLPGSTRMQL